MIDPFSLSPWLLSAVPVVAGIVQALKSAGLPRRITPVASVAIGIALICLFSEALRDGIVGGIIVGLAASGLWSGSKATLTPDDPV